MTLNITITAFQNEFWFSLDFWAALIPAIISWPAASSARRSIGLASCKETWKFSWFPKLCAIDEARPYHTQLHNLYASLQPSQVPLNRMDEIRWTSSGKLVDNPEHRLLSVFRPSGSKNSWWRSFVSKTDNFIHRRTIARPTPFTTPVNIGARCKLFWIISWLWPFV